MGSWGQEIDRGMGVKAWPTKRSYSADRGPITAPNAITGVGRRGLASLAGFDTPLTRPVIVSRGKGEA